MVSIGIFVCCTLLAQALMHVGTSLYLICKMWWHVPAAVDDETLPKAGVILAVRGADPHLRNCLRGLLNQNYPQYHVEIVVDSVRDPAWQVVQEIIREIPRADVRARALTSRGKNRSLKCSALIQGVNALDESHAVLAFCDADVVPHDTWLRELVAPLLDPRVGAATGNRWYAGPRRFFGSQARVAWNAGAVSEMALFGIPWGGSLALRRQTLDDAGVLALWSQSFNDDLVLGEAIRRQGLELRFVPSVVMVDRGEISFGAVQSFVFRQLMHMRFYHHAWRSVAGFGLLTSLQVPAALVFLVVALGIRHWGAALWSGGCIAAYVALLAFAYRLAELAVSRTLQRYGRDVNPLGARALWCAPLAVFTFAAALLPALFRHRVNWGGVVYHISAPWHVELLADQTVPCAKPALHGTRAWSSLN